MSTPILHQHEKEFNTDTRGAAFDYAALGWHVLPLRPGEKLPLSEHGVSDASADVAQIRAWWQRWPDANVGIAPGPGGAVVLDFDTSKPEFAGGDLLAQLLTEYPTRAQRTPSGGYHLLYLQPEGVRLGNSRGDLPRGVDVRGHGGYIVVAPSLHPNGKRYRWLNTADVAPLPEMVLNLIRGTSRTRAAAQPERRYTATDDDDAKVAAAVRALSTWRANDREAWKDVGMTLQAWDDARGLDLWHEFSQRCPEKYTAQACDRAWRSFKSGGGLTIASLYKWADTDNPGWRDALPRPQRIVEPGVAAITAGLRAWCYSAECITWLRDADVTRAAGYSKTMAALAELAHDAGSMTITPGLRTLAQRANMNHVTVSRHLRRLAEVQWLEVEPTEHGTLIKLKQYGSSTNSVSLCAGWHAEHLQHDAFVAVSQRHGHARRVVPVGGDLVPSLGPAALHVWRELQCGDATRRGLVDATGLTAATVRSALSKMEALHLVHADRSSGRSSVWRLVGDAETRLTEVMPQMTSYGSGLRWAEHADRVRLRWLHKRARAEKDVVKRSRLLLRLDRTEARAQARGAHLVEMGIKPIVGRPGKWQRYDHTEEHATQAQLARDLAVMDGTRADKVRYAMMAGHTQAEVARAMRPSVVERAARYGASL